MSAVGVDTVGLAFPIVRADTHGASASVVGFGTDDERVTYRRKLDGGGFMAWGVGRNCWVEASLPKRCGPDNINAVPFTEVGPLLASLHAEALEHCEPDTGVVYQGREGVRVDGTDYGQAAIKRLDLVRDFDGVAVGPMLDGLAGQPRAGRVTVRRFADSERGNSETLRVGVRSAWSCVLYDKHAETDGAAPPGRLRFEARLRDDFLTGSLVLERHGHAVSDVRTLLDCDYSLVRDLAAERFRFVGFGSRVTGTDAFADAVNNSDLSERTKRELIAFLCADHLGVRLEWHRSTLYKYRKLARDLGITLGTNVAPDVTLGLDFDEGGQVLQLGHTDGDF